MPNKNGQIWKWAIGILVTVVMTLSLSLAGVAFTYGGKMEKVDTHGKIIEKYVYPDHETIIALELKIEQLNTTVEQLNTSMAAMSTKFTELNSRQETYKNEIISEIRGLADGN